MLVFLHGFLGSKRDWLPLFHCLPPDIPYTALDLPGHGDAPFHPDIIGTIKQQLDELSAKHLVGYSAGGRLALALKDRFPDAFEKIIVLSGHPGITNPQDRALRWEHDQVWIEKLRTLTLNRFLELWYAQPLFESLHKKKELLHQIILQRSKQDPSALAAFLEVFSAGRMPAPSLHPNTLFVYGEEDLKYRAIYHTLPPFVAVQEVAGSGHILPLENPERCRNAIIHFLKN